MTRRSLVPGLILIGLVVLVIGTQWARIWPSSAYWTDKQAAEYTEAQVALHSLSHNHGHGHGHDSEHKKEFAAAKERYDKINGQLTRAQNSRERSGTIFIIAGILTVLFGIGLHFVERSNAAS